MESIKCTICGESKFITCRQTKDGHQIYCCNHNGSAPAVTIITGYDPIDTAGNSYRFEV